MEFDRFALANAEGAVLAHSAKAGDLVLRKGHRLSSHDLRRLHEAGVETVVAARIGDADVAEDRAAAELAALLAGASVEVATAFTGRANLHSTARGLLVVDRERVDRFNRIDEAVTLATLPEHALVEPTARWWRRSRSSRSQFRRP